MQTEDTGLLPDNVEMLVTGKQTYDIYPEGPFLLDVFECRGSASVAWGYSRKELQEKKESLLDSVGVPDQSHAVKIDQGYSNILLSVNSELALIRWLPLNVDEERGIGYYLYNAGSLKYDARFGELAFTIEPLSLSKKIWVTHTKIKNIVYSLYISNS
jgi:hypothetical protein